MTPQSMTMPSPGGLDVLVVSECFEAGTGAAIESIANGLPEVRFHLLWAGDAQSLSFAPFASVEPLTSSALGRVRQVRRLVNELGIDLVHAHSSWAGVYARARALPVPVVYQPHCFGFANPGRGRLSRRLSSLVERLLAPRVRVLVAVSEHEAGAARQLGLEPDRVRVVPNSSALRRPADRTPDVGRQSSANPTVLMIGRLAAQKDPAFFAQVSRLSRRRGLPFRFIWIGDGAAHYRELVGSAGAEVTGWLSRAALAGHLDEAFAYAHTAIGEGFPISILDAAAFQLPIVVRPIPALREAGLPAWERPEQFVDQLERWHIDRDSYHRSQRAADRINVRGSSAEQADRMRDVYASVSPTYHRPSSSAGSAATALLERQDHR